MEDKAYSGERIIKTTCASHCGGSCVLKLHLRDGVITRIETDDGEEPQFRACWRGRSYRQRVYAPDRILYPLKRISKRGEARFARISWDEALDTIAREIIRVRDTYGPASILYIRLAGDLGNIHNIHRMREVLSLAGGCTTQWGSPSFQGAMSAQWITYGTCFTDSARDDLINSRLIIMWGWNPANTVTGVNTNWYLAQAKEAGAKIIAVDPRFTDSVAVYADHWIPIRPGTDGAMMLAMTYVIIEENLQNQGFLNTYAFGFDKFKDYVTGADDGIAKTPAWAEAITGVPANTIVNVARDYANVKPAALMAGVAPGRTSFGEQYHRIAITLATMTGNVGIHGGNAAGWTWSSIIGGYPYKMPFGNTYGMERGGYSIINPVDVQASNPREGVLFGYRPSRLHTCQVADFIEKGKAGGYAADCKLIAIGNCNLVGAFPNVNRTVNALASDKVEFIFINEQFMTPTVKFADIVLPTSTFLERNDMVAGVGFPFYGHVEKAIEPLGESKSHLEIASLLASRLGISYLSGKTEEEFLREQVGNSEIPDYEQFKQKGVYRINLSEPYIALKKQIEDPVNNPFNTPSGKIEIYSQKLAELNITDLPPIPKYIETWESRNDPLLSEYPLQLITSHIKRRSNHQFENIPWLRELEPQAVLINSYDAQARGIRNGDLVRVFNKRGQMVIPARVTERIMPGVVDVPQGAWYDPDENGVDKGGCANVLTNDTYSPGGALAYNTCLVEVKKV